MFTFAQTNLQLYRQLEVLGYSSSDRERVAQAYRFLMRSFSGLYRGSEKPFITHLVGTASILAYHKLSIDLVLTGLLHAVYRVGDFGFEPGAHQTRRKRECIRNLMGKDVESIIAAYDDFLWNSDAVEEYLHGGEVTLSLRRSLIILSLANTLEDQLDGGVLYCGEKLQSLASRQTQDNIVQLATALALPELAAQLEKAFEESNRGSSAVNSEGAMGKSARLLPPAVWRSPWVTVSGGVRRRLRRLNASPNFGRSMLVKNAFDKVFSVVVLLLISPVFSLIALGIKLESPGPIFFKQRRHGLHNVEIEILKFRTMDYASCNGGVKQAVRDDARVTRFGRLLRMTSLDELPQFLNVLCGDMSVVGPRPHPIALNENYMTKIDDYMERHAVKPGITGWAQVHGFRGPTDTLEKMQKRVEYDFYYIGHHSLGLDIKIIFLTAIKGWTNKNAL